MSASSVEAPGAGVAGFAACAGGLLCATASPPARLDDDSPFFTSVTVRAATSTRYFWPLRSTITFEEEPLTKVIPLALGVASCGADRDISNDGNMQSDTNRSFKPR